MAEDTPKEALEDDRSVEISAIAAIFPEMEIDSAFPLKAKLDLPVALSQPTNVCFEQPTDVGLSAMLTPPTSVGSSKVNIDHATLKDTHSISHLPPLSLEIELPDGYPSEKPPIVRLSIDAQWLPMSVQVKLTDDCKRLWEECGRDMVVFTYIDHLQQLAESAFGILGTSDREFSFSRELKIPILDFNSTTEKEKFEKGTFECGVCLEPKKGAICYRLLRCSHVFCIECLQDFYNTCIDEGDVDSVKCMAPGCDLDQNPIPAPGDEGSTSRHKKRDQNIGPSELLQIPLSTETVQRYVFLKRKKKIEADKNTVYCPRSWCQGAGRSKRHPKPEDPFADFVDVSDEEESGFDPLGEESQLPLASERLAMCEDCSYAFCKVCKKGWHGELVRCFPRRQAEQTEEEKATEEYLRLYTSPCPTCNVPCQKIMGCNHMRCFQCDTHFCYLCSAWLSSDNPYTHFNDLKSQCYNRLWDLEGGDGVNPEGAEALHRIPDALDFDDLEDEEPHREEANHRDGFGGPLWELDISDDDNEEIFPHGHPPPPAPVPPQIDAERDAGADPDDNGLFRNRRDAAVRAAAHELRAQARAINEIREMVDEVQIERGHRTRQLDQEDFRQHEEDSDESEKHILEEHNAYERQREELDNEWDLQSYGRHGNLVRQADRNKRDDLAFESDIEDYTDIDDEDDLYRLKSHPSSLDLA